MEKRIKDNYLVEIDLVLYHKYCLLNESVRLENKLTLLLETIHM